MGDDFSCIWIWNWALRYADNGIGILWVFGEVGTGSTARVHTKLFFAARGNLWQFDGTISRS